MAKLHSLVKPVASTPPCSDCGHYLSVYLNGLCETCNHRVESARERKLMDELGIPAGTGASKASIDFGTETPWSGMHEFLLGVRASVESWPPPWPYFRIGPMVTQVWLRQITIDELDVLIEARWSPETGTRIMTSGEESLRYESDMERFNAALRMVKLIEPDPVRGRGRPKKSGKFKTLEAFLISRDKAFLELMHSGNPSPSQEDLALCMEISTSTFIRYQNQLRNASNSNI